MLLLLVLSLSSIIDADFASDHVHQYLNLSVAPCDNFYRHVCSIGMDPNDTVWKKSEKYYKDIATKLKSRTLNNPVMVSVTVFDFEIVSRLTEFHSILSITKCFTFG